MKAVVMMSIRFLKADARPHLYPHLQVDGLGRLGGSRRHDANRRILKIEAPTRHHLPAIARRMRKSSDLDLHVQPHRGRGDGPRRTALSPVTRQCSVPVLGRDAGHGLRAGHFCIYLGLSLSICDSPSLWWFNKRDASRTVTMNRPRLVSRGDQHHSGERASPALSLSFGGSANGLDPVSSTLAAGVRQHAPPRILEIPIVGPKCCHAANNCGSIWA